MRRLAPPLTIEIAGQLFQAKDWSITGFAICDLERIGKGLHVGSDIEGRFGWSGTGTPSLPFSATIADMRRGEDVAAFEFTELFAGSFAALEALLHSSDGSEQGDSQAFDDPSVVPLGG